MLTTREFLDLLRTADAGSVRARLAQQPELARARDDAWGDAALTTALARDDAALVAVLLDAGADVNEACMPASTVPCFTFARSVAVAERLAAAGADWTNRSCGAAALATAARASSAPLVEWLIARGARPSVDAFRSARFELALIEPMLAVASPQVLDALLVDCLGLDDEGKVPERARCAALVARLLSAGARPVRTDALHRAAEQNQAEVVKLLLEAGDDPNRLGPDGSPPLVGAAYEGAHDAVAVLLAAGADPDRRNAHGQSARSAMQELGDDVLRGLLERTGE